MKTVFVIRHIAFEDLGAFAPVLQSKGYDIQYCDVGVHDLTALQPRRSDLVIVLGGPIGAYEEDSYPFLKVEISIIEERLKACHPTMGICLGAQLIARAAGAHVYPSLGKEIGFAPITLTEPGNKSCLAPFGDAPMTLHWHGDTFDLPPGAERLASTALCENQAFSLGSNIIGFQFHPEADTGTLECWLIGHAVELAAAGVDLPSLRTDAVRYRAELIDKAQQVAAAWLEGLDS